MVRDLWTATKALLTSVLMIELVQPSTNADSTTVNMEPGRLTGFHHHGAGLHLSLTVFYPMTVQLEYQGRSLAAPSVKRRIQMVTSRPSEATRS